ncbi:helix-turn-helix domain-containing protein [Streptomyces phaeochromogenes]|uniref:helix-turn-helix domain-containing protein n=1 Tax=Streptomyces phaeochromogenes TaxID=1923 RepID=UPI0027D80E43|nr:AraC family transcriptional regulator [Streptomyces phaeochromogenes]
MPSSMHTGNAPSRPGRATFHYLIAVTEGELQHDVDHVTRTVTPGQWLWVRPGHAQCWHPPGAARGPFILFEPDVLRPDLARLLGPLTAHAAPAVLSPHPDDTAWLQQTALQLLDEHRALGRRPLDIHHALRRSLLESLLLPLANSPGVAPIGTATAHAGRADRYGRFLDARRLLEAARWDARSVAVHLGFTDPANFGRFFRDRTGLTPAAFAAGEATTVPPPLPG